MNREPKKQDRFWTAREVVADPEGAAAYIGDLRQQRNAWHARHDRCAKALKLLRRQSVVKFSSVAMPSGAMFDPTPMLTAAVSPSVGEAPTADAVRLSPDAENKKQSNELARGDLDG